MTTFFLQPRLLVWPTQSPAPLLDDSCTRDFTARLSPRECSVIAALVEGELRRVGLWHARVGGRFYCAAEERVIADVVAFELDLCEIGAQLDEARFEQGNRQ